MDRDEDMLTFFNRYAPGLYRYAALYLEKPDAEDVVSDTLLSFYLKAKDRYDPRDHSRILRKSLFNSILKKLMSAARHVSYEDCSDFVDVLLASDPSLHLEDERAVYIDGALQFLTPYQRLLILSIFYLDMTRAEIAELLGVNVRSLNRAVERVLVFMRRYIEAGQGLTPEEAIKRYRKNHAFRPKSRIAVPDLEYRDGKLIRK